MALLECWVFLCATFLCKVSSELAGSLNSNPSPLLTGGTYRLEAEAAPPMIRGRRLDGSSYGGGSYGGSYGGSLYGGSSNDDDDDEESPYGNFYDKPQVRNDQCSFDKQLSYCCNPTCFHATKTCESCCSYGFDHYGEECFKTDEERSRCCTNSHIDDPRVERGKIIQVCDAYGFINSSIYGEVFFFRSELSYAGKKLLNRSFTNGRGCDVSFLVKDKLLPWDPKSDSDQWADEIVFNNTLLGGNGSWDHADGTTYKFTSDLERMRRVSAVDILACPEKQSLVSYGIYDSVDLIGDALNYNGMPKYELRNVTLEECYKRCGDDDRCGAFTMGRLPNITQILFEKSLETFADDDVDDDVVLRRKIAKNMNNTDIPLVALCRLHASGNDTYWEQNGNYTLYQKILTNPLTNITNITNATNETLWFGTNVTHVHGWNLDENFVTPELVYMLKWYGIKNAQCRTCMSFDNDYNLSKYNLTENETAWFDIPRNNTIPFWGCDPLEEQWNEKHGNAAGDIYHCAPKWSILPWNFPRAEGELDIYTDENGTLFEIPHSDTRNAEGWGVEGRDGVNGTACACSRARAINWTRDISATALEDIPEEVIYIPSVHLIIGAACVGFIAFLRISYKRIRIVRYQTFISKVIPKPYFPTSGSVWSLKRYEYNYPVEMKVVEGNGR